MGSGLSSGSVGKLLFDTISVLAAGYPASYERSYEEIKNEIM